jgi:hypothetical protein
MRACAGFKSQNLGLGVYHGLRKAHLPGYLDEFVFRWNRRRHTRAAFGSLLGIGTRLANVTASVERAVVKAVPFMLCGE